ncbi:hypothetical protein PIB30_005662 [Stylosanthes scabra]|uniref:Uncharacterized protein n=1 Tax=Stylosanthes scabra TaxID=79078 RepID=A0ABU6T3V1_9FABA|nr:hypothetical protein [Stylosanthes scabra]
MKRGTIFNLGRHGVEQMILTLANVGQTMRCSGNWVRRRRRKTKNLASRKLKLHKNLEEKETSGAHEGNSKKKKVKAGLHTLKCDIDPKKRRETEGEDWASPKRTKTYEDDRGTKDVLREINYVPIQNYKNMNGYDEGWENDAKAQVESHIEKSESMSLSAQLGFTIRTRDINKSKGESGNNKRNKGTRVERHRGTNGATGLKLKEELFKE